MDFLTFLAKRFGMGLITLIFVSFVVYGLLFISPGSAVAGLLGGGNATPEQILALEMRYGLDRPFIEQYLSWLSRIIVDQDLGSSILSGAPVSSRIGHHIPVTVQLGALTLGMVIILGVPLGLTAARYRGKPIDRTIVLFAIIGMSGPAFAFGILLMFVFGVWLNWLPVYGAGAEGWTRLRHLILPASTLALGMTAYIIRQARATALNVYDQDYVTFAKARNLSEHRIRWSYVFRNSSVPIFTMTALLTMNLISGAAVVETVFSLQGVGALLVSSVQAKDIPVVQGIVILVAALIITISILVEIVTVLIDPRIGARVRA